MFQKEVSEVEMEKTSTESNITYRLQTQSEIHTDIHTYIHTGIHTDTN